MAMLKAIEPIIKKLAEDSEGDGKADVATLLELVEIVVVVDLRRLADAVERANEIAVEQLVVAQARR